MTHYPRAGFTALLGLTLLLAGCQPASPGPAAGPSAGPPASNAPALTVPDYRQAVIDGARQEGQLNVTMTSTWSPDGLRALEAEIEREFGVRVQINFTPVGSYPQRVGSLLTELAANTTPSFDLYQSSDASSLTLLQEDALEPTQWDALLPSGTPAGVVQGDNRLVVVSTGHIGAVYDPNVIPDAAVPRSIKDLADARLRGKLMLHNYTQSYLAYVYRMGREPTFAALRAAVQSGAPADTYANGYTRFAAKEYPIVLTSSSYYHRALATGVPAKFASVDFSLETQHHLAVARRAARPNAARLLAAVLAGPEGQRIAAQYIEGANRYYESSVEYRLQEEARAAGLSAFRWTEDAQAMALLLSPEGQATQREIEGILQGQ
jgi:ABC-type Fe3+ transport system substrate-binding protein